MPPPIPLSGTGAWYSAGSQSGSASNSANDGRIASQAASAEADRSITACTLATNPRTTEVSRTNSSSFMPEVCLVAIITVPGSDPEVHVAEQDDVMAGGAIGGASEGKIVSIVPADSG